MISDRRNLSGLVFDAWYVWFCERWRRGEGTDESGSTLYSFVWVADYDGFGGEW